MDEPRSDRLESYWPGAEWVDLLGFDAYNWGNPWLSHREMIDEVYGRVTALAPSHKVWLCEFGCKEPKVADGVGPLNDRFKAQWIADLMSDSSYPQLEALVWFSVKKERDWRIDSTRESLEAFLQQVGRADVARALHRPADLRRACRVGWSGHLPVAAVARVR